MPCAVFHFLLLVCVSSLLCFPLDNTDVAPLPVAYRLRSILLTFIQGRRSARTLASMASCMKRAIFKIDTLKVDKLVSGVAAKKAFLLKWYFIIIFLLDGAICEFYPSAALTSQLSKEHS